MSHNFPARWTSASMGYTDDDGDYHEHKRIGDEKAVSIELMLTQSEYNRLVDSVRMGDVTVAMARRES